MVATPSVAADLTPQQIYERSAPGVVMVIGVSDKGKGNGGTGSIIRQDGLVLTNAHVVIEERTGKPYPRVLVFLKPDRVTGNSKTDLSRRLEAQVQAVNPALDLAILKTEGRPEGLPVLELADPRTVRIGDRVAAIGHPEQGGLWTLTTGVVSAEFEDYQNTPGKDVFQTETGLNRGNSGGPLLDAQAHVIGINTAIARLAADGLPITSISFSLKSSVALKWLRQQGIGLNVAQSFPEPERRVPPSGASPGSSGSSPSVPAKPAQPPAAPPQAQTQPRPYSLDNLVGEVSREEADLEGMMKEMRGKTRPRP
jgi:serine protease Do